MHISTCDLCLLPSYGCGQYYHSKAAYNSAVTQTVLSQAHSRRQGCFAVVAAEAWNLKSVFAG